MSERQTWFWIGYAGVGVFLAHCAFHLGSGRVPWHKAVGADDCVYEVGRIGTNAADCLSAITNHSRAYLPRVQRTSDVSSGRMVLPENER